MDPRNMNKFARAMFKGYGLVLALFVAVPAALVALVNPSEIAGIIYSVACFAAATLVSGLLLARWAGEALPSRHFPSYAMGQLSLVFGAASTVLASQLFPAASEIQVAPSPSFGVFFVSTGTILFFGCIPAVFASSLFVGNLTQARDQE